MPPHLVYHYTTPAGLLGIISNRCIWLTDVEFMNDAEEVRYAQTGVVDELRGRVAGFGDSPENGYRTAEGSRAFVLDTIANELERGAPGSQQTWHAYATCFCEDGDLLSQWRGYSGVAGFAVGFLATELQQMAGDSAQRRFVKVDYGLDAARQQIDLMLEEITPGKGGTGHPNSKANVFLMDRVLPRLVTIKHPAFAEEREWRLTHIAWGLHPELNFRPGSFGITPYADASFTDGAIAEIVIGPGSHSDVRIAGVRQLLEHHGLHHVAVRESEAPFRS